MSFQISPELDAKKVFLVRSSELEGRLDPNFYSIISKPAYNFICIKKIAKVKGGKRIPKGKSFSLSDTKFRYMRVEDIANNKLVVTSLKCISKELFEFLERYEVKENDLVISIAGTVGRTIIVNNDTDNRMILTENAAKIVLLSNKLTVDALNIILQTDLVQNQIKALYIQTTIPKLGLDKILNLKIPIPSIEVQSAIVAKMDAAYSSKREKEAEAQRLLDSIDAYLLGELGIELPEQKENNVQSRIFIRRFSEISGGRFDAPVYQKTYLLETKLHPMMNFKEFVIINPLVSFSGYNQETLASFLPMEKVSDRYGEAKISDCRTVNESGGYTNRSYAVA